MQLNDINGISTHYRPPRHTRTAAIDVNILIPAVIEPLKGQGQGTERILGM